MSPKSGVERCRSMERRGRTGAAERMETSCAATGWVMCSVVLVQDGLAALPLPFARRRRRNN